MGLEESLRRYREARKLSTLAMSRSFKEFVNRYYLFRATEICNEFGEAGTTIGMYNVYCRMIIGIYFKILRRPYRARKIKDMGEIIDLIIKLVEKGYAEPDGLRKDIIDALNKDLKENLLNLKALKNEYERIKEGLGFMLNP
jgi:hypothetical protein